MRYLALLTCAVAVLLGGCSSDAMEPRSTGANVELRGIAFVPETIEIDAGTAVTWSNVDDVDLHTVTSGQPQRQGIPGVKEDVPSKPDGTFDHDLTSVGQEFSFSFDEPGTYVYFCEVHAGMTGRVVVR